MLRGRVHDLNATYATRGNTNPVKTGLVLRSQQTAQKGCVRRGIAPVGLGYPYAAAPGYIFPRHPTSMQTKSGEFTLFSTFAERGVAERGTLL